MNGKIFENFFLKAGNLVMNHAGQVQMSRPKYRPDGRGQALPRVGRPRIAMKTTVGKRPGGPVQPACKRWAEIAR